jgi:pyruvate dehydrogenase E2 component (dihydrolipoyllysine-residue acetyltransferase)
MYEFKLADLGEGMHEAEIVEWLVKEGDTAKLDQTIARVETDKAIVELPSPVTGRVGEIRVKDGQTAKVGEVLVVFETANAANGDSATKQASTQATAAVAQASTQSAQVPVSSSQSVVERTGDHEGRPYGMGMQAGRAGDREGRPNGTRVQAAPAVRKLAFELGIDLAQVTPSGSSGRISLDDVRAYAERAKATIPPVSNNGVTVVAEQTGASVGAQAPTGSAQKGTQVTTVQDRREPLTGLRKRIAEHMERSWRTIPHATAFGEVDGTALVALRSSLKPVAEQRGVRLTYMPLLIKLLLPVLKEFPIFNASLDEEKREIIYKSSYHIGVAADSPEGLLVPVLRDADHLTVLEIASKLEKLIEGARKRTLALPELSGSTFTLNNVGSFGGGSGTPIINHPEVAILAVGRLQEKAVVQQGAVLVRPMMPLALSFDHRLIDGALSGKFLARFTELVENPAQLMLDMV